MSDKLPSTSQSLPFVLLRAREQVMSPIRKMLAESKITEQQWRILRVLEEAGPLDSSTLAERASISFPSLTRIAHSMSQKGLIHQERNTQDRRRLIVSIADAGAAIIQKNRLCAGEIAEGFRVKMGSGNYEQLVELLILLGSDESDHLSE